MKNCYKIEKTKWGGTKTSGTLDPDDDDVKKNEDNDTEDAKVAHVQSLTRLPTQQTQRVLEFALMIPEVELNWAQRPLRAALSTNSLLITEAARANDALFPYFQFSFGTTEKTLDFEMQLSEDGKFCSK